MSKLERDLWRMTIGCLPARPRSFWANLRFMLGMHIGGFKKASR